MLQIDFDTVTWECMACKQMRLDRFITVTKIEIQKIDSHSMPMIFNFRHCNDRVSCIALANRTQRGDYFIAEEP